MNNQDAVVVAEPISFDIEIASKKNDSLPAPPVKLRLEEYSAIQEASKDQLTLQMINEKLERAYERKVELLASQVEHVRESAGRVGLIQERKSSRERAAGQRIINELGQRQATAEAKRHEQLNERQEKARAFNKRVLLIRERKSSQERAEEERAQTELAQKHLSAGERQTQLIVSIQNKAKTHNEKVAASRLARHEEEQRQVDSKKTQIEEKLSRAASNRNDPAEKARAYNAKYQEKLSTISFEHQESIEERKAKIEAKLSEAASRREGVIE